MPNVAVVTNGNNVENIAAFWINVPNVPGGFRWGVNGQAWDTIQNIANGNYQAGIQVQGINLVNFQITIPQANASIVFQDGENEIIIGVVQVDQNNSTINIDVNN